MVEQGVQIEPTSLTDTKLANGLRVIIGQLPARHTVSVNVRVDAGARHEPPARRGLAHFVEHMLLQGTPRYPSSYALTSRIEMLGGELSGMTHAEYASYWLETPRMAFDTSLPAFQEMLRAPLLDSTAIEREKRVIIEEIAEAEDDGLYQAQALLDTALWHDHPVSWSPLGSAYTMQQIGVADVRTFFAQHYTPGRMVLAAVGDYPAERILEQVDRAWHDWEQSSASAPALAPLPAQGTRLRRVERDDAVTHIVLGIPLPPLHAPNFGAYRLLQTLLGGGMSSLLFTALRGHDGLCYHISSDLDELRHGCVLNLTIVTQPDNLVAVVRRVRNTLHHLATTPVLPAEIERRRGQAIGALLRAADSAATHARLLSLSTFLYAQPITLAQQVEQIRAVEPVTLQQAITMAIRPENLYAGITGPIDDMQWQTSEAILSDWNY